MEETVKNDVVKWFNDNRNRLPLNVATWKVEVLKIDDQEPKTEPMRFGKYNDSAFSTEGFYKAISRSINIKNDE